MKEAFLKDYKFLIICSMGLLSISLFLMPSFAASKIVLSRDAQCSQDAKYVNAGHPVWAKNCKGIRTLEVTKLNQYQYDDGSCIADCRVSGLNNYINCSWVPKNMGNTIKRTDCS